MAHWYFHNVRTFQVTDLLHDCATISLCIQSWFYRLFCDTKSNLVQESPQGGMWLIHIHCETNKKLNQNHLKRVWPNIRTGTPLHFCEAWFKMIPTANMQPSKRCLVVLIEGIFLKARRRGFVASVRNFVKAGATVWTSSTNVLQSKSVNSSWLKEERRLNGEFYITQLTSLYS